MPIDASIYRSQPTNVLDVIGGYQNLALNRQKKQANALALQQEMAAMQEKQRALEEMRAVKNILAGAGGSRDAAIKTLEGRGYYKPADELRKAAAELAYKQAQTEHVGSQMKREEADTSRIGVDALTKSLSAYRDMLSMVRTKQDAVQWTAAQYQDPTTKAFVSRIPMEQMVQSIPEDEAGFNQWRQEVGMGIEKFVQNQTTQRGQNITLRGQDVSAETTRRGQDVSAETSRRGQDISASTTRRGQDITDRRMRENAEMADRRAREMAENKGAAKPLPARVVQDLQDARDSAATMDALSAEFKDEYAGKGIVGVGSDLQLDIASRLGVDKGSVLWWKDYRKMVELVERHAKFGASLSKAEQASWRSADINPGMDPSIIKKNLAARSVIAKKVLENTAQDAIDSGHAEDRVQAIANRTGAAATLKTDPVGAFADAEKERRYQEWKAKQK